MLEKLSLNDLQGAIAELIQNNTGIVVWDQDPESKPVPRYLMRIKGKENISSKTAFLERYTFWIHAIASAEGANPDVYDLVQLLEEALTEDISLPQGFCLIDTSEKGVLAVKDEPGGQRRVIVKYEFTIAYGLIPK